MSTPIPTPAPTPAPASTPTPTPAPVAPVATAPVVAPVITAAPATVTPPPPAPPAPATPSATLAPATPRVPVSSGGGLQRHLPVLVIILLLGVIVYLVMPKKGDDDVKAAAAAEKAAIAEKALVEARAIVEASKAQSAKVVELERKLVESKTKPVTEEAGSKWAKYTPREVEDLEKNNLGWKVVGNYRFPMAKNNQGKPSPINGSSEPSWIEENAQWVYTDFKLPNGVLVKAWALPK